MLRSSTAHTLRKSDLLEISIAEILFIMIFALLINTHFAEEKKKVQVSSLNNEIIQLKKINSKLKSENAKLRRKNRDLKDEIQDWRENYKALITIIEKYIPDAGTLTPKEAADRLDSLLLSLNAGAGGKAAVVNELARLKKENRRLRQEVQDLTKKIKELQRLRKKEGGGGRDKPKCVVSGYPGIIDYLFEITMAPENYSVKPLWDRSYDPVIFKIIGAEELAHGARMSYSKFTSAAKKVLNWSERQNPKCRFYVKLRYRDNAWASVSNFNRHKNAIDHRFYFFRER